MAWRPEMDLIDQLSGQPMPLHVVVQLFDNVEHAGRVLRRYLDDQVITFQRYDVNLVEWQARELLRNPTALVQHTDVVVALTHAGGKAFKQGAWDTI